MVVVSVCSLKGGVGKTSVVLGLASAAMTAHVPTLVVDLDPQADATTGLDVLSARPGDVATAMQRPKRRVVENAISPSGWTTGTPGRLDVMLGSHNAGDLDGVESGGRVDPGRLQALPNALKKVSSPYELVLIDCPPNLGALTRSGMAASDRALVVCEPGLFSVAAAERALRVIDDLRAGPAPDLRAAGVVVNRYRERRKEHEFRVNELRSLFDGLVLSPVLPERSVLQQAQGAGRPIHEWPSQPARDLAKLFDELLARVRRPIKEKTGKTKPGK